MVTMQRTVSASIDLALSGPVRLIYSVAVAQGAPISSETLEITVDGTAVEPTEIIDAHGTRLHSVFAQGSNASLRYRAVVDGVADEPAGGRHRRDRLPAAQPLLRVRHPRPDRRQRVRRAERSQPAQRRHRLGQPAAHVRLRIQPADRRRRPDAARPPGSLPRLRPPLGRAAALAERAGPAGRGLRPGTQPDGVPRGGRGAGRRSVVGGRRHRAGPATEPAARRHRPRCRRHGVPDQLRCRTPR